MKGSTSIVLLRWDVSWLEVSLPSQYQSQMLASLRDASQCRQITLPIHLRKYLLTSIASARRNLGWAQ